VPQHLLALPPPPERRALEAEEDLVEFEVVWETEEHALRHTISVKVRGDILVSELCQRLIIAAAQPTADPSSSDMLPMLGLILVEHHPHVRTQTYATHRAAASGGAPSLLLSTPFIMTVRGGAQTDSSELVLNSVINMRKPLVPLCGSSRTLHARAVRQNSVDWLRIRGNISLVTSTATSPSGLSVFCVPFNLSRPPTPSPTTTQSLLVSVCGGLISDA